MKFAVKTVTCLGCKTPLRNNKGRPYLGSDKVTHSAQAVLSARIADRSCPNCTKSRYAKAIG